MVIADWISVIKTFHEKPLPELVLREQRIPIKTPLRRTVTIIGPRRAGKTFAMYCIIKEILKRFKKEKVLYVNLERPDLGILNVEELNNMVKAYYSIYPNQAKSDFWLFLDEVQNVPNWESFVRQMLDEGVHVFISGSSSRMLSKEIATSMRGRSLLYKIFPFSFREMILAKGINVGTGFSVYETAVLMNLFNQYFEYGGYPEVVLDKKERELILADIKETILVRDVIERNRLRQTKVLRLLIDALLTAKEFSVNKFHSYLKSLGLKISKNTLYKLLQSLEDAFLVFSVKKFSWSYKDAEQSIPKIYFVDNGFLRVSGITDRGRLLENLVFAELLRKEKEIHYYKSVSGEEVDFVIKKDRKIVELIQACYTAAELFTKQREIRALINASKEFKCNKLTVVTYGYEAIEKHAWFGAKKTIKFIPAWKWLLEK